MVPGGRNFGVATVDAAGEHWRTETETGRGSRSTRDASQLKYRCISQDYSFDKV